VLVLGQTVVTKAGVEVMQGATDAVA
jgi:hypothetical protein